MRSIYLLTAAAVALTGAPVFAADKDKTAASGGSGIRLKVSGQVNRGVLFTDDGGDTDVFFVDNDNSSTRFRFTGEGDINANTVAGIDIEIQAESNSTAAVNQNDENATGDFLTERKLEFYFENTRWGRVSVGQGASASDGTSEVDLSGTAVVGYSGVEDFAGGILFRGTDGTLSDISVGAAFTNLDGLNRVDRIRYDTPSLGGLRLSTSAGSDSIYDFAARYATDFGDFKFSGAVAYASTAADDDQINGSVSILQKTTGLSLTLAGGTLDRDDAADTRDTTFGYVKAGYQTNGLSSLGKTAFAIDYTINDDVISVDDESTSYGLFAVQNIDRIGTEIYAGIRNYELDSSAGEFDDVTAVLVGARLKF